MAVAELVGCQEPTVGNWPEYPASRADEVFEVAELAGLQLDEWQRLVLSHALGVHPDGRWTARHVGVCVPRQNGKGAILEALELGCLFVFGDRQVVHSAHEWRTSLEHFKRLRYLIESAPDLDAQVNRYVSSHGEEGIELKDRRTLHFRTRTKGGGRGLSGDKLILDEAMFLPEMAIGALVPIVSAKPNPQIWYTGSAVDFQVHDNGVVFSRLRQQGHKREEEVAWFEWSANLDGNPDETEDFEADPDAWAASNPALAIRVSPENVRAERRLLAPRTFAVERLGIGDWPDPDADASVLDLEAWAQMEDKHSEPQGNVCFTIDASPDQANCAIGVAGIRSDALHHLEVAKRFRNTDVMLDELERMMREHDHVGKAVLDAAGPAGALVGELKARRIPYHAVSAREHAQACGLLFDTIERRKAKHLSQRELTSAIKGADRRPLGDAWAWARKSSATDISPLVAVTLALWGLVEFGSSGAGLFVFDEEELVQ